MTTLLPATGLGQRGHGGPSQLHVLTRHRVGLGHFKCYPVKTLVLAGLQFQLLSLLVASPIVSCFVPLGSAAWTVVTVGVGLAVPLLLAFQPTSAPRGF